MPPVIAVADARKVYGGRRVVDDVSFEVAEGQVCVLLGPNGAGKTTLVECLEGLRRLDAGTVRVLGRDPVRERDALLPDVGVMLQEGGLYQGATPVEMLRLFAAFYPRPRDVDELLAVVGLAERRGARIRTLSGGEKQRLSLALALVGRPRVALLDEPTGGMDSAARRAAWALLERLRDEGLTVLLTTHHFDEAERLADVVAVLAGGRLRAFDTVDSLGGGDAVATVVVTAARPVDAAVLARALAAPVEELAEGRYRIAAGPDVIPRATTWLAAQGVGVTAIGVESVSLEERYLRLVAS